MEFICCGYCLKRTSATRDKNGSERLKCSPKAEEHKGFSVPVDNRENDIFSGKRSSCRVQEGEDCVLNTVQGR